jgi:long-chain-fatty-acyl-CoA reductase
MYGASNAGGPNDMSDMVEIPLIICGEYRKSEFIELNYESGQSVRVPRLTEDHVSEIRANVVSSTEELDRLTIQDVTAFLSAVGQSWLADDSKWRRYALRHAPALTGYPLEMLASDYFMIGEYMRWRTYVYDQVASELGHEHIFDEWIPVQASYVRAFGLGLALHVLVGNLPLAGMYSVLRSIISRNTTLAKLPTRDPVSSYALVAAMLETDPSHPIARSLSLGYWPHGDPAGRAAAEAADVICTWGGASAVYATRAIASPDARLIDFGPKWSAAVIDLDRVDLTEAATRLAAEVSYYDQEACFSPQRVFVRGDVAAFVPELHRALALFAKRMPLRTTNRDVLAHRSGFVLEGLARDWEVRRIDDDAVVVVVPDADDVVEHPLTRTAVLHPVASLDEVTKRIDHRMQTLSVFPWELGLERRDAWAAAGATRLVELGMSRHPRHGFSHDGMRWLNQMVRFVSMERSTSQWYKYGDVNHEALLDALFVIDPNGG